MGLIWARSSDLEEILFGLPGAFSHGFMDVRGEFRLKDDIVMQVIFQVFCTLAATMAVIYAENL